MDAQGARILRIVIVAIIIAAIAWLILWWPAIRAEREYEQSQHERG